MASTERLLALSPDKLVIGSVTETAGVGSSSTWSSGGTPTAYIELRMQTATAAAVATNLTMTQVLIALDVFREYLLQGGVNEFANATGGLPLPAPAP